jgi:hypothetical protein
MKSTHYSLIILLAGWLIACSSPNIEKSVTKQSETPTLIGYWTLEKEEQPAEKHVQQFTNKTSEVILNFQKNGYFLVYDSLVGSEVKTTGIAKKAIRKKGQWEMNQKAVTLLTTQGDSTYTEKIIIQELTNQKLSYTNEFKGKITKFSYKRKS